MTNEELFKTPRDRMLGFIRHCQRTRAEVNLENAMNWLSGDYKMEELTFCPFCQSTTSLHESPSGGFFVSCNDPKCDYHSGKRDTEEAAVLKHNEIVAGSMGERIDASKLLYKFKHEGVIDA